MICQLDWLAFYSVENYVTKEGSFGAQITHENYEVLYGLACLNYSTINVIIGLVMCEKNVLDFFSWRIMLALTMLFE